MEDGEGHEKVKLGLGIGVGCDYSDHNNAVEEVGVRKRKKEKEKQKENFGGGGGLFTAAQMIELEQQVLIYKHLAAALPVPFHLLLPIWNSVAASLGPSYADSLYKQFHSFIGFSPLGFDYRQKMDPEPGRCRRTDGKKWRCSRKVVPDEKYCKQHMHRGRQRSRKPVENSEVGSPSSTKTPKNSERELWNSKTSSQISIPKSLQLSAQCSDDISVSQCPTTSFSGYQECKINMGSVTTTSIFNMPANRTPTTTAGPTTATNGRSNENNLNIIVKSNSSNHAGDNCMIRGSSNNRNNINVGSNLPPALGFSPKSVLQGRRMTLLGCNGLYFDSRSGVELEPGRCRRTDGKKWRCRRDVLPDQKYCGLHIHRGAKRQMKPFQPDAGPSTSAVAMSTARLSQTTSVPRKTESAIPNTNLSISIPASPPVIRNNEKSNSSSDSDTTLTDTSLTAFDSGYVSS